MNRVNVEFEIKGFGKETLVHIDNTYKSVEIACVNKLPKETTLGELESILKSLFNKVEEDYTNSESFFGKITIRVRKENNEIESL
ncbi:hypothetical protein [Bacillus cereus]|uniref:hypothetical protein n=1 Tax=Bacillus cereus TaxID=1396 RepID=UPI000BF345E4|nr:hypothetical protein [Bacillus cereus]PER08743.1 hypothetical protein CN489_25165 [Bacillus cereus]